MAKISVFTPTHDPKYLGRAKLSLMEQTFQDFEWVVVPNKLAEINEDISGWDKIQVHPYMGGTSNIGEIKLFAAKHCCKGDILVELDHDDELTPNALESIYMEFQDKSIDFVYSNFVELNQDGSPKINNKRFGWKYNPCVLKGKVHLVCKAFPPTPASLCKIWTAPNHVRAWRRDFYNRIGGHNPYMVVCDDQELLCETYLNGKMKHIDKCLYIYHIHESNSCYDQELNAQIQEDTLGLHDKYIDRLVEKWCQENGLIMVDLRGDSEKAEGYESINARNPELLYGEWPFDRGKVGMFRAVDSLCYIENPIKIMQKIHEYLAPEGWLLSKTPSTDGRGAFQNPLYKSFWNENSFLYYTDPLFASKIGTPVKFMAGRTSTYVPDDDWHKSHFFSYVRGDLCKHTSATPGDVKWKR